MNQEPLPQNALYDLIENEDGTYTLDISEGVCTIHDLANWDIYHRVSVLRIPASLQEITLDISWYFDALQEVCVHPDNSHFIVEDGVLFTADKKKMLLYPRAKAGDTYHVDDAVEVIGPGCFAELDHLKNIYIGKDVRKIEHCALDRDMRFHLNKIYIPPTVTELEGEIFDDGGDCAGTYYPIEVVGGAGGSAIEAYCNHRGIDFVTIAEDEVEGFYASTVEELRQRAMEQAEQQTEYWVEDRDKGYRMHVANGTLEVTALDDISVDGVVISDTRDRIGKYHRKQVKALIIGAGITAIDNLAFDDYEALESIAIGPDVCRIEPAAFDGLNGRAGKGCCKVSTITVDERNGWYTAVDNVLYTADMTTLVKYAPQKPDLYHGVDARVRHIGDCAFDNVTHLQCLKVGEGCVSVGEGAFVNTGENLRHVYFAASVTDWPEVYPFYDEFGFDCWRSDKLVIGGPDGSAAQAYLADEGLPFHVIEEHEIADFMATPLPDEDDDPYVANCAKEIIVDKYGIVRQAGKIGEELVFYEGAVRTYCRINLSPCKRVVIPSTMTAFWTDGLDGPAPDLAEFVVAEDNPTYMAVEGHLCTRDGRLLTYAPAAAKGPGVLPEGITSVDKHAFSLTSKPFDRLCLPASLTQMEFWHMREGLFHEVVFTSDSETYSIIDGSLFSKDGKVLVRAKVSRNGYEVPDGVEKIGMFALDGVKGTLVIPPSVTEIAPNSGLSFGVDVVRVTKGSYAEQNVRTARTQCFKTEIVCPDGTVEVVEPTVSLKSTEPFGDGELPF